MTLLKKDDLDALVDAFKDMHQQEFTDKVMKDLFKEEEQIPTPSIAGGWMSNSTTISPLQNTLGTWSDPRLAMQAQNQAMNTYTGTGITSVSKGGTGTTATTGLLGTLTGIFK